MSKDISRLRAAHEEINEASMQLKSGFADGSDSIGSSYSGFYSQISGSILEMQTSVCVMEESSTTAEAIDTEKIVGQVDALAARESVVSEFFISIEIT